jgi:O-antigen ligase
VGVGGFDRYAPLELHYPHNLLLEVGSELGWIPLFSLVVLLTWSVIVVVRILRREYAWHTLFLSLVFMSALMNAMVSGDLNDNRVLYATFLLPFTYWRMQAAADAKAAGRLAISRARAYRPDAGANFGDHRNATCRS